MADIYVKIDLYNAHFVGRLWPTFQVLKNGRSFRKSLTVKPIASTALSFEAPNGYSHEKCQKTRNC